VLHYKCNGHRLSYAVHPQEGDQGQVYLSEIVGDRCIGIRSMGTMYGGLSLEGKEVAIKMVFPEHHWMHGRISFEKKSRNILKVFINVLVCFSRKHCKKIKHTI